MATETKVVEEAFKEGEKAAKKSSEIATLKAENATLQKARDALQRGYNTAISTPNKMQLGMTVGAAVATSFVGYKINSMLEEKTSEWIDEETSERTTAALAVQHGTAPLLGVVLILAGAWSKNGATSSLTMGGGAGLILGSLLRSVYTPDPDPEAAAP